MHGAVVGGGLAGLGVAHALTKRGVRVDLFDKNGIGSGASGIASGLLHPYPGKKGLKSKFADEGMAKTLSLINLAESVLGKKVALRNGILRKNWEPVEWFDDLEQTHQGILIKSGCTVYMKSYLKGLLLSLEGVEFFQKELMDKSDYDFVVYAMGKGMRSLDIEGVQYVKGQILTCRSKIPFERSVIGSGHISPLEQEGMYHVGSTYEHHAKDDNPDQQVAISYLKPRIEEFCLKFNQFDVFDVVDCSCDVRVCMKGSYLPMVVQNAAREFIFTGLGSRGLLYHALFGEKLAEIILQ